MQPINTNNIPDELKAHKSWVLWRYIIRAGQKTKVLYQATGAEAKSNDPSTWTDFKTAMQRYSAGNWEGIGFVFSPDDPYTGIDLDGCRTVETQVIEPWAKSIISSLNSYAELSPSLSGVKIWVRGSWPVGAGHNVKLPDAPKVSDKTPGIEVYDWGRFFTVTGKVVGDFRTICENQLTLDTLRELHFKTKHAPVEPTNFRSEANILDRARKYVAKMEPSISGQDGHGKAFHVACVLVKGFALPQDDALGIMREWNATCQPPWSERELLHKVTQAGQQNGENGYLRNVSPENYQHVPMPSYRDSGQKPTKKADESIHGEIRETLMEDAARNAHREFIDGKAKMFDIGLPDLDYAIGGGIEPGEMVIFAGRPSHGKSMAAQQATYTSTANGIPVLFVSEEMSARAIGKRAIQYATPVPAESWGNRQVAVATDLDNHFKERAPCYILEGCKTADRVAEQIHRYVEEKKVGLIVIDYAQTLIGLGRARYEQITYVSSKINKTLKECAVPGIILCQMSRDIEKRGDFIPVMSDLKETGQFEQDADVIVFQVWPHKIDPEKPPEEFLFFIAKNRNRTTNAHVVKCRIEPMRQRLVHTRAPLDAPPSLQDYPSDFGGVTPGDGFDMDAGMLDFGP